MELQLSQYRLAIPHSPLYAFSPSSAAWVDDTDVFLAPQFSTNYLSSAGMFNPDCNPLLLSGVTDFFDIFHSESVAGTLMCGAARWEGVSPDVTFKCNDVSVSGILRGWLSDKFNLQYESNDNDVHLSPFSSDFFSGNFTLDFDECYCPCFFDVAINKNLVTSPYGKAPFEIKFNFAETYGLNGCKCQIFYADNVGFNVLGDPLDIVDGSVTLPDMTSLPVISVTGIARLGFCVLVPAKNLMSIENSSSQGYKRFAFKTFNYSVGDDGENELFQIGVRWKFAGFNGVVDFSTTRYTNPLGGSDVPISALPFRAYEMIYNSFYRDARNNPYVLNGEVQYNQFIPTVDGGLDDNIYPLRYRNWEYDFLTTCQPTPQFGNAPLVGITAAGKMTFVASEDGQEYNVQAEVADDGSSISSVSYSENIPNSVARSLVDVVSSGISINDFRNVNSFQRFLETTMRRGLKAVDQLKAHFDVDASYNALDMPEFIGGISTVVDAQKVNNLNGDGSAPLGDYAGQLSCIGNQRHKVRCYCDEPGFIIGIVCVHPVPLYSQLLPKFFLKRSNLDYFFPEFGHIGLQPVLQREVSPLQVSASDSSKQTDVFGYQRAWYDYLSSVDEVHGLFRTQLRDYVLNRSFFGVPKLSPDFTVINPEHLNDIFTVQDVSDKILGKIVFNVKAVRPIPKYGIPKID